MKHLMLAAVAALILSSCGAMMPGNYVTVNLTPTKTSDTLHIKGSKSVLYARANLALVDFFNSPESVIEYQDKEAGIIAGKYNYHTYTTSKYHYTGGYSGYTTSHSNALKSTIKIFVSDNMIIVTNSPQALMKQYLKEGVSGEMYNVPEQKDVPKTKKLIQTSFNADTQALFRLIENN